MSHLTEIFPGASEMAQRMQSFDWSQTPLGAPTTWPRNLHMSVRIILTARQPMSVWWGEDLINLYNDGYAGILRNRHPLALGQPARFAWPEIWEHVSARVEFARRQNAGTYDEALWFATDRSGFQEETYVTFSYSPIPNDEGGFGGILCPVTEETRRIVGDRELAVLQQLAAHTAGARTPREAGALAAQALATDADDLPFALIYVLDDETHTATLAGRCGLAADEQTAPERIARDASSIWPIVDALDTARSRVVSDLSAITDRLPVVRGMFRPTQAVMLPLLTKELHANARGVLIVGLSPLRRYDHDYERFLELVAAGVSSALRNAQLPHEAAGIAAAYAPSYISSLTAGLPTPSPAPRGERFLVAEHHTEVDKYVGKLIARKQEVRKHSAREREVRVNTFLELARVRRAAKHTLSPDAQAVQRQEDLFRLAMNNVAAGVYTLDLQGLVTYVNPAAEAMFGWTSAELLGKRMHDLIHYKHPDGTPFPAADCGVLQVLQKAIELRDRADMFLRKDGGFFPVVYSASPLKRNGQCVGIVVGFRDDSERREAERVLRESERRLAVELAGAATLHSISTRLISESTSASLYVQVVDAAIELMRADAACVQMLAADGESLTVLGAKNRHPDSTAFWERVSAGAASTSGQALRHGTRIHVVDVEGCDFMAGTEDLQEYRRAGIRAVQSTPLRSRSRQPLGVLSTHWRVPHTPTDDEFRLFDILALQAADLIERALADDVIRESEERLRLITKTAPVMIWITDAEGQVIYLNQMYLDFTGLSLAATLGDGWMNVPHPDDLERCRDVYVKAAARREPFQIEHRLRRHDGEYRWVFSAGVPRSANDGSFAGYIGTALDVTERKLAEEALAAVSQRLIETQEEERARLGRELHDDINQRLVTLSWRLGMLAQRTPDSEAALRNAIDNVNHDVTNLVNDIQALSYGLHPPQLEYLGIAAAAASLCREMSDQQDVKVSFRAESIPQAIPQRISLCLYRILQESLQNAIKHSGVRHVEVSLCGDVDQLTLTVHDSGVGFDPDEAVKGHGLGLTSMKERLKAVQGQLFVDSRPQCGTTIRASVPLSSTNVKTAG